jgi:hypothetical protein
MSQHPTLDDNLQYPEPEEQQVFDDPPPAIEDQEDLSYGETLNYSQRIRRQIVDSRMVKGVPEDDDSVKLVLTALKDMDKTALDRRRNEIDADSGESAKEIAQAMQAFIAMQGNGNPFMGEGGGKIPSLTEQDLGEYDIPAGEMESGVIEETSEEFQARMEQRKADAADTSS